MLSLDLPLWDTNRNEPTNYFLVRGRLRCSLLMRVGLGSHVPLPILIHLMRSLIEVSKANRTQVLLYIVDWDAYQISNCSHSDIRRSQVVLRHMLFAFAVLLWRRIRISTMIVV